MSTRSQPGMPFGLGHRRSPIDTGVLWVALYTARCRRYVPVLRRLQMCETEMLAIRLLSAAGKHLYTALKHPAHRRAGTP